MRLSKYADYALRALAYLVVHEGRLSTIREIAECCGISRSHLTGVVWQLGRAGHVRTVREKKGGIRLARPAQSIPLGAVVRPVERTFPLAECFPDGAGSCRIASCCRYRSILAEAEETFFAVFDHYTVRDLVHRDRRGGRGPGGAKSARPRRSH